MAEQRTREIEGQWVVFRLAGELYATPINLVREIVPPQRVTPIPGMPGYAEGVTNLRGRVVPVVDLKRRLALPHGEQTADTRIMMVETNDGEIGCVVDAVDQVMTIAASAIQPAPAELTSRMTAVEGIARVDDSLIVLVNLDTMLRLESAGAM